MSAFSADNKDLLEMLAACSVEITFNPDVFWHRMIQQTRDDYSENEHDEPTHLVLVDWTHNMVAALAMGFMSTALQRRPRLLDTCHPCKIIFVSWEALKALTVEADGRWDTLELYAIASLILRGETIILEPRKEIKRRC